MTTFPCGHDKTPRNSSPNNYGKNVRCRSCHLAQQNRSWANRQAQRREAEAAVAARKRLSTGEAIELYRLEKSKRENRVVTAIESVRPQYAKAIEKPKGGRPVSVGRGRKSA